MHNIGWLYPLIICLRPLFTLCSVSCLKVFDLGSIELVLLPLFFEEFIYFISDCTFFCYFLLELLTVVSKHTFLLVCVCTFHNRADWFVVKLTVEAILIFFRIWFGSRSFFLFWGSLIHIFYKAVLKTIDKDLFVFRISNSSCIFHFVFNFFKIYR